MSGVVASRNEFLSNAAIDYVKKLADEGRYIGTSGFIPQVEVASRTFQWESFDPSTYVRYKASVSPYEDTKRRDSNPAMVDDSINKEYRFGAGYNQADIDANGNENVVQLRRTYESSRIVMLDYEVAVNAVMASATQTAAATAAWGTGSSDPVADFRAAAEAIGLGFVPNKVALTLADKRKLATDVNFRGYVKGTVNDGIISTSQMAEAIGAIFGLDRAVEIKTLNAAYNTAASNTAGTYTAGSAFADGTIHVFYGGDGEDPFEPAAFKEFYLPSAEGVFVSGDPDNDEARDMKVVAKKLVRKAIKTSDILAYRITGA